MSGNAAFPNTTPTLAQVTAAIAALNAGETAALARTKGAVLTRNNARTALVTLLKQLLGNIQTTADADLEHSAALITSAGVTLRKTPEVAGDVAGRGRTGGAASLLGIAAVSLARARPPARARGSD